MATNANLSGLIGAVPRQRVTEPFAAEAKLSVTTLQKVKWEEIPQIAFDRARLEAKVVSDDMGKSKSWLYRALKGLEKFGWLDLGAIKDKTFIREVAQMMLEHHGIEPLGLTAEDLRYMRIGKAYCELQAMTQQAVNR